MSVTKQEIKTLARLARLEFDDGRVESFIGEFEEIIGFADRINQTIDGDTSSIQEVGGREEALCNLREDKVEASLPNEKIVSNVQSEGGFFPVKRVVK